MKTKRRRKILTDKQQKFIEEFAIEANGSKAAVRAGYSKKSAAQIAYENLSKPKIRTLIEKAREDRRKQSNIDRDALIGELLVMVGARSTRLRQFFVYTSKLPSQQRWRARVTGCESRAIEFERHLRKIIEIWKSLDINQTTSASGRSHVRRAIVMLEDERRHNRRKLDKTL